MMTVYYFFQDSYINFKNKTCVALHVSLKTKNTCLLSANTSNSI